MSGIMPDSDAGCKRVEGVDVMCEIADRIRRKTDFSVLGRWIRCAAFASSIAEFETNVRRRYK